MGRGMIILVVMVFCGCQLHAQMPVVEDTEQVYNALYFDSLTRYSNDDIHIRQVPDSAWKQLKQDDDYWYADVAPGSKQKKEDENFSIAPWLKTLVWIIIVISMISAVVWFLMSSDIRLFRKPSAIVQQPGDDLVIEDIFSVDYDHEISRAIAERNYRLAVRLFYLRALRDLSDKEIIRYQHETTNSEYLAQLAGTYYYKDFFRLTRDFEYVWYGKFDLSDHAFTQVQNDFIQFNHRLAS